MLGIVSCFIVLGQSFHIPSVCRLSSGRLAASLISDFLQVYNLDFTLAVFQPEINLVCRPLKHIYLYCLCYIVACHVVIFFYIPVYIYIYIIHYSGSDDLIYSYLYYLFFYIMLFI